MLYPPRSLTSWPWLLLSHVLDLDKFAVILVHHCHVHTYRFGILYRGYLS